MFHFLMDKLEGRMELKLLGQKFDNTIDWVMAQRNYFDNQRLSVLQYAATLGDQEFFEWILEYQRKPGMYSIQHLNFSKNRKTTFEFTEEKIFSYLQLFHINLVSR